MRNGTELRPLIASDGTLHACQDAGLRTPCCLRVCYCFILLYYYICASIRICICVCMVIIHVLYSYSVLHHCYGVGLELESALI